ncbi:unnamed protein product [Brachionus calyciflorus]|uniref:Uncharacterized protein n=1 Tax=Brachionus calyciflorus TaxID=104777 RepID=A0A814JMZ8_9BILA|nr:unnamed protein product [Brachionus calyciflorus]
MSPDPNVSHVHSFMMGKIMEKFVLALKDDLKEYCIVPCWKINVKNIFKKDREIFRKEADFAITNTQNYNPIIGEIAYKHENINLLVSECLLYITKYVNCFYSIGIHIDTKEFSKGEIFILERINGNDIDQKKVLDIANKLLKHHSTVPNNLFDLDFLNKIGDLYQKENLTEYGVKCTRKYIKDRVINFDIDRNILKKKEKTGKTSDMIHINISNEELLPCQNLHREL